MIPKTQKPIQVSQEKEIKPLTIRGMGWKPDLPDARDVLYRNRLVGGLLPIQSVNLFEKYKQPDVFDQGNLGSCTGNAIASVMEYCVENGFIERPARISMPFSRLFIYYNERVIEGTTKYDDGAYIRDGFKTIAAQGACSEKAWPYDISKFDRKPPKSAYTSALNYQAIEYQRINNTSKQECVDCLQRGFPFVLGFTVYTSFLTQAVADSGVAPFPDLAKESVEGGHCVFCYGYDLATDEYLCQNSWGLPWGDNGKFRIPAKYLNSSSLADDFWTVRKIE